MYSQQTNLVVGADATTKDGCCVHLQFEFAVGFERWKLDELRSRAAEKKCLMSDFVREEIIDLLARITPASVQQWRYELLAPPSMRFSYRLMQQLTPGLRIMGYHWGSGAFKLVGAYPSPRLYETTKYQKTAGDPLTREAEQERVEPETTT